jgi:(E)-4-hydroxy-3-methylbut-2-enyl-diphosphate synthase
LEAEEQIPAALAKLPNVCIILNTKFDNKTQLFRRFFLEMQQKDLQHPVVLSYQYQTNELELFQLYAGADAGAVLIDGFGDGIWLNAQLGAQAINSTAFGILQATRTRISKTEYISCPSCGRTLFDLQETTAKIRQRTSHLKGIKIGIMGCIVNGPGEMADADYGYVGTGPGKINLYKEKEIVRRNINESEAVEALVDLIREYGDWQDPKV